MAIKQKNDRIDVRVKTSQKSYLMHAATLRDVKLSTFVLESAMKAAEEIVNQNVHFALSDKQWKAFCVALDQPAREITRLKKLFSKSKLFDDQKTAS